MATTLKDLYTMRDVAGKLKVSVGRVSQFISEGRIKPVEFIGNAKLFDRKTIDKMAKIPRNSGRPKKSF